MSVRQTINEYPVASTVGLCALLAVLLFGIQSQVRRPVGSLPTTAFFTVDDGKTWFKSDLTNIPPFDYAGGTAVGCTVFAGKDGKQFVGLLTKFSDQARSDLNALVKAGASPSALRNAILDVLPKEKFCKQPGVADWSPASDAGAMMKMSKDITAPDGSVEYSMVSP